MRCLTVVVALVACSSQTPAPSPPPPPPVDARPDGITTIDDYDPASGMHLDDDGPNGRPPTNRRAQRPSVPIGVMLRSSPVLATVFVDGENVGSTPMYWAGYADGKEHEFSFTRQGYRLARYRFVPVSSGTLHATLERIPGASEQASDPVVPKPPPAEVAPPPTILTPPRALPPPDAAPVMPAVDAAPVARSVDAAAIAPTGDPTAPPIGPDP